MNPKYCVSLETAKRLKELGFFQTTDFFWIKASTPLGNWFVCPKGFFKGMGHTAQTFIDRGDCFAAPHVGELGMWLPQFYGSWKALDDEKCCPKGFICEGQENSKAFEAETEAEARAKCLIYLAEQKLLDLGTL